MNQREIHLRLPWKNAVHQFLKVHDQRVEAVREALTAIEAYDARPDSEPAGIDEGIDQLRSAIAGLRESVAERAALLSSQPLSPPVPRLLHALMRLGEDELAQQCQHVSQRTAMLHSRAITLFVCHFQLAELLQSLIHLIASGSSQHIDATALRGGLLDNAA
jgi:hypothetical protein